MVRQIHSLKLISFFILILLVGVGCGDPRQYTLEVQGTMTVGDAATLQNGKLGILNGEQQVLIGTTIIEVKDDFFDGLGVDFVNLEVQATFSDIGTITLGVTPDTIDSGGIIFKRDDQGQPFGQSFLEVTTTMTIPNADPTNILLGDLLFQAENSDPNSLPLLGNIPVINFLFNNQSKRAQVDSLIIMLTPTIIQDLE